MRDRTGSKRTGSALVIWALLGVCLVPLALATGKEEKLQEMVKTGRRMADPASEEHNPVMAAYFFFRAAAGGSQDALDALRELAGRGEPEARWRLGILYLAGKGVPQDSAAASTWFRMAAEQGHADAQLGLAGMYRDGQGVPADPEQAYFWFRLAETQGESGAKEAREQLAQHMNAGQIAEAERRAKEWRETRGTH